MQQPTPSFNRLSAIYVRFMHSADNKPNPKGEPKLLVDHYKAIRKEIVFRYENRLHSTQPFAIRKVLAGSFLVASTYFVVYTVQALSSYIFLVLMHLKLESIAQLRTVSNGW